VKIYTRKGDDGTTGLYYGGRVRKDDDAPRAYGAVDEAQAAIGVARADAAPGGPLDAVLVQICRDLYVCMAELATLPENRSKLEPARSSVTAEMVATLEPLIDAAMGGVTLSADFVIPGATRTAALLDVARTVVRRAERESLAVAAEGSHVVAYLNRLSDLLWALARAEEGSDHLLAKKAQPAEPTIYKEK
jgi:cob(I)alamin adenosyltransferase